VITANKDGFSRRIEVLNNSSISKDNEQDKNQKKIDIDTFANGRGHFSPAPINTISHNEG